MVVVAAAAVTAAVTAVVTAAVTAVVTAAVTAAATAVVTAAQVCLSTSDSSVLNMEMETHDLVNAHRVSIGRNALTMHDCMRKCARAHSANMAKNNFFSHSNNHGDSPFNRMQKCGISYSTAGENIAAGYRSASACVSGWLNSSGHRANIENGKYTHGGMGYASGGGGYGRYWTQVFAGNPR
ncbi:MAG: CAP domain-containing protein [Planctomycetota bacterium]